MGFGAVWLVVTVALLVAAVAVLTNGGADTASGGTGRERAHDILRRRFAAGEIGQDEYRERTTLLGSSRGARSSVGWLPVAVIVVALLAAVMLLISVASGSGGGWWGPMGAHMDARMGQRTTSSGPAAIPDAREITIELTEMEFDPATIEVTVGEPVNLTITNRGETFHDLTIGELDLQIGVDSGQSVTTGLELDEPGEFEYYCSVPGHAAAGMQGTLTVLEPRV